MTEKILKVVVFVPATHADGIRDVLQKIGAGKTKKYEGCSFSMPDLQSFRSRKGAGSFAGKVEEERIETFIPSSLKKLLLNKIKEVHPYEKPVIDFYKIESSYTPV